MSKNTCRKVFVTGTDTDIGKTYATATLAQALLQQTQQAFIQAATQNYPRDFAHPYYWAAFAIYGDWNPLP